MPVVIRMTRAGGKKTPFYRVVAADKRSPRDGRFIEQVGIYDPLRNPPEVRFDLSRIDHWLKVGAQPSDTVRDLVKAARKVAPAAEAKAE